MTTSRDVDWKAGFSVTPSCGWHLAMDKPYQREVKKLFDINTISLCGIESEYMVMPERDIWQEHGRVCRDCLMLDLQNSFLKEGTIKPSEVKTLEELKSTPPQPEFKQPLPPISEHRSMNLIEYRPNYAIVSNDGKLIPFEKWRADYTTSFSIEDELPKPDPIEVPDVNNDQVYDGLLDRARREIKGYSGRRKLIVDRARTRKMRWESEKMFADMWKRTMAPDSAETRDAYAEFDREWRRRNPSPIQMIVRLWKKVFGWLKR